MTNQKFIAIYGKKEFVALCKSISTDLKMARLLKEIGYYKIHKMARKVTFFTKDNRHITLDFANIYHIGIEDLNKYIEREAIENGK